MSKLVIYIICLAIVLVIGITFFLKRYFTRRAKQSLIPEPVIAEFNLAEKMLKESGGKKTPYEIMWEIARNNLVEREMKAQAIVKEEELKGGSNQNGEEENIRTITRAEFGVTDETNTGTSDRDIDETESAVSSEGLPEQPERREDIQTGVDSSDNLNSTEPGTVAQGNNKSILGKFFSRRGRPKKVEEKDESTED